MFARIARAFRPLDTSEVDAAIAAAQRGQRDVRVRARALRMDVSCGDATAAIAIATTRMRDSAGAMLRAIFDTPLHEPVPPPLVLLLDELRHYEGGNDYGRIEASREIYRRRPGTPRHRG